MVAADGAPPARPLLPSQLRRPIRGWRDDRALRLHRSLALFGASKAALCVLIHETVLDLVIAWTRYWEHVIWCGLCLGRHIYFFGLGSSRCVAAHASSLRSKNRSESEAIVELIDDRTEKISLRTASSRAHWLR